jgi:radical SAM protein with 4Fe4S-binding SPASM domain
LVLTLLKDFTPRILVLPDSRIILLSGLTTQSIRIQQLSGQYYADVSGHFAQDIGQLFNPRTAKQPKEKKVSRLLFLEKQYPWLKGLSQAQPLTEHVKDAYALLMGSSLGMLFIELTSQCNEKCIHCYADSAPERSDFLQLDEIKQVLVEARHLGQASVQLTGGDPLIHRNLLEILAFAYDLDFSSLEIYTNGLLLNQHLLDKIKPFQPRLAFSMYSHDAATHDAITRVKGSHQRTCDAIQRAMHDGFKVRVSVIQMQENEGQAEATHCFLSEELGLKPEQIKFHLNRSIGRGMAYSPPLQQAKPTESIAAEATLVEAEGMVGDKVNANKVEHKSMQADQAQEKPRQGKLCVSANGDVLPCVFSRNTVLGNVKKAGLLQVLSDLQQHAFSSASASRWQSCQEQLSCGDCQLITYMLGDDTH